MNGHDVGHPSQRELALNYLSGVRSVEDAVATFDPSTWMGNGCGEWTALDTVRHLVGVIDWYEQWLDRALNGISTVPFPESEFDTRNAAALQDLQHLDGPEAVSEFGDRARRYLDRAESNLDTQFGYPGGTVTVGLHLAVAAAEWHLHAWDLTSNHDHPHQPENAASLFNGAGACLAAAKGGIGGRVLGLVVPIAARRSPWKTILKESGRVQRR